MLWNKKPEYVRSKEKHQYPIPLPPDTPPSAIECSIVPIIKPDILKCFDDACPFYDKALKQWAPICGEKCKPCNDGGAAKYATCDFGKSCPAPVKPAEEPSRKQCNQRPPEVNQCFMDGGDYGNCRSSYNPVTKDWSSPTCHNNCNAIAKIPGTQWKWKDPNCELEDQKLCKDVSASYYYDGCKKKGTFDISPAPITPDQCTNAPATIKNCFKDAKCADYNRNTKTWMTPANETLCGDLSLKAQQYDKCDFAKTCPTPNANCNPSSLCFFNDILQMNPPPFAPLVPCSSYDKVNKTWVAHNNFIDNCVKSNDVRKEDCSKPGVACPQAPDNYTNICPELSKYFDNSSPTKTKLDKEKSTQLKGLLDGCLDTANKTFKNATGGCHKFFDKTQKKWVGDDLCDNLCNRMIDGLGVDVAFYEPCYPLQPVPPAGLLVATLAE